jgi:hypothetical protein
VVSASLPAASEPDCAGVWPLADGLDKAANARTMRMVGRRGLFTMTSWDRRAFAARESPHLSHSRLFRMVQLPYIPKNPCGGIRLNYVGDETERPGFGEASP